MTTRGLTAPNPTTTITTNHPLAPPPCGLNPNQICREESDTSHSSGSRGLYVGGRGGNAAHRVASAGTEEEPLVEVRDWSVIRDYRYMAPSRLRSGLIASVKEIGLLKVHKSTSFKEIVQWAMQKLPEAAPDHPRTAEAKAMATYFWRYRQ